MEKLMKTGGEGGKFFNLGKFPSMRQERSNKVEMEGGLM